MANVPLRNEIVNDPIMRGYSGMTDQQVADSLNDNRDRQPPGNPLFPASEVLQRVDKTQFLALDSTQQRRMWDVLHLGDVNPWGLEADILIDVFGAASATITALQVWRDTKRISRAAELGLGRVLVGHVTAARA